MAYQFTAKPIRERFGVIVDLINGATDQRGMPRVECTDSSPQVIEVIEAALIDEGYCIDALERMPAGACFGEPIQPPYAAAIQRETRR